MPYFRETLTYPVDPQPTWHIQDASKVKTFMECPRKYFYEYVLGWRREGLNNHLVFGDAWHKGLAVLYDEGFDKVERAVEAFLKAYRQKVDPEQDDIFHPKTPWRAALAYGCYALQYKSDPVEMPVAEYDGRKMIEVAGNVMLSKDREMSFIIDTICEHNGYIILEHKTGSSTWGWENQWYLSPQIWTYIHVLYSMFSENEVRGAIVNGWFWKKTKHDVAKDEKDPMRNFDHLRVPIYRNGPDMEAGLVNIIWWLDQIAWNFDELANCSRDNRTLACFPMNNTGCGNWGGCSYLDFCRTWQNPLQYSDEPPMGFQQDFWNPLEEEKRVRLDVK
jgi:hypothetical protein